MIYGGAVTAAGKFPPLVLGADGAGGRAQDFGVHSYATHHPDETIQYLEQAHRIVFGYGVVPWEFRYFIRSWLIPLLLVPPMALGEAINPGGTLYLILPRAMVVADQPVTSRRRLVHRRAVYHGSMRSLRWR